MMRTVTTFLVAILLVLAPASAEAQFRGGIQGVVIDPDGATIADATVSLTNSETGVTRVTKSGAGGVYVFAALAPGSYRLAVGREGFAKKTLEDVKIDAEQTRSLIVTLEIGAISDSVTVTQPSVPLLETQTPTIGTTLTARDVENLPSFGRDPFQTIRLAPGAFGDGAQVSSGGTMTMPGSNRPSAGAANSIFFIENGPQVTANGTRPNSNLIQVDGVGVNSVSWGGSAVLTPGEESIKEIRVVTSNYSAENGRNSGAQIMVISKNGTNDFRGSLFFKAHRPDLNAFQQWNGPGNPSPVRRDTNSFNQEGGSVGGPILRNRLFGFFSYETQRNSSVGSTNQWFETPEYRQLAGPAQSMA